MISYSDIKHTITIGEVLRKYGFRVPHREIYRISCPIHNGRDANFSVSERDGLWNCFSVCGRGGSVIDLVAILDGVTIKEAADKLSKDFNLSPAQASVVAARTTTSKVERYKDMKKEAPQVELPYTVELEEGYRDLNRKTIDHWGLRRVPSIRTVIHPIGSSGSVDPLDQYGSIGWKYPPSGVMIPLHNAQGGFCSYSVRKDDVSDGKYWNAKGFSKCYPFGLHLNAQSIIDEGFVWLVEGQFDAIALWQKGYKNVVALMGSSISEQQAMLLLSVTSTLMLCMDGDDAGRLAAAKIKKQWGQIFEIGVFNLPEGVDPDEFTGILER
jgi:DNA primase